jgi:hypothetical protein
MWVAIVAGVERTKESGVPTPRPPVEEGGRTPLKLPRVWMAGVLAWFSHSLYFGFWLGVTGTG